MSAGGELPPRPPGVDPLEWLLQERWFQAQRLCPPVLDVHPDDEMARLDLQKTTPERRRSLYMRYGHEGLVVLRNALEHAGRDLARTGALLDFACGYGRVLRFIADAMPPGAVDASDVVVPAVDFVGATLGVNAFPSRTRAEEIEFPRRYAVISVFSLFSHLPRPSFAAFLRVLFDRLEPDGLLLFSTHSPAVLPEHERDPSGFTYVRFSGIPHLDVEEYGTTHVAPDEVRAICAEAGIEHLWTLERELWRIQDMHVVARRDVPGLRAWTHARIARGAILSATRDAEGNARAVGYARVPRVEHPVSAVSIVVDGEREIPCPFLPLDVELPATEGGRSFAQSDWMVEGPAPELAGGVHTVAAVATTASGARSCIDVALLEGPAGSDQRAK